MSENQAGSKKKWKKPLIIFAIILLVLVMSVPYTLPLYMEMSSSMREQKFDKGMEQFVALDGRYDNYKITVEEPALYTAQLRKAYKIEGINDMEWRCVLTTDIMSIREYKLYRHKDINEEPILDWEISEIIIGRKSDNERLDITDQQIREIQEILRGEPLQARPEIYYEDKFSGSLTFVFKDKKGVMFECGIYTVDKRKKPESPHGVVYLSVYVSSLYTYKYYDVTEQLQGAMDKYFKEHGSE